MIRIAICDDELIELERIKNVLKEYIQKHSEYQATIFDFVAPLELLSYVETKGNFDLVFLDIYMDGILGIDVARELRQRGDCGEIIFITSSRDHAIEAFEVEAVQYLLKPFTEEMIDSVLDKVLKRIYKEKQEIVTMKTSEGMIRFAIRDVVFTETGRNNYQMIHTIQGRKFEVRMTATEMFELFSQNEFFIRCGASISLNLKYVRQISKKNILFDTGESLGYPYRSYQNLKEAFLRFQMFDDESYSQLPPK